MKATKVSTAEQTAFPPFTDWIRKNQQRLGVEGGVSVDNIDAGIRTLAVVTVLVLSLFGFGKTSSPPLGIMVDPRLIALALVVYNVFVVSVLGVPWRRSPHFGLFLVDWAVV